MTQGLQFSVLFSSADNMLSIDASAANLSQTSPELQQQAERFRQVLASEQADGTVRQDVAAVTQDVEHGVNHQAKPAVPGKDTQLSKAANESADTNKQPSASDESSNVTDAAGELLGLIQRANLTASQLQKKADTAAEQHHIVPQPQLDKAEPVEDELSVIRDTALPVASDKDLTAHAGNKEDDTNLKAVTPVLSEDPITPESNPEVTADNKTSLRVVNSELAATGSAQAQTQPVTLADTQLPDDGLTPVPGTEQSEVISATAPKAQQREAEQKRADRSASEAKLSAQVAQSQGNDAKSTPTAIAQSVIKAAHAASATDKLPRAEGDLAEQTALDSAVTPSSEFEITRSATTGTAQWSERIRVSPDAEASEQSALRPANTSEQQPAAAQSTYPVQSVSSKEKEASAVSGVAELSQSKALNQASTAPDALVQPVMTPTTSALSGREGAERDIAGNTIREDVRSVIDATAATQVAVQAEAVARTALSPADSASTQESKASRQTSQQPANMASSNDVLKSDTNAKSTGDERGAEQGTEQRLFQPSRIDVTLTSGSAGQGSTQSESFQQQLARLDASVASVVAAQRASEKTPVSELSARLKQLNLQQQDAAGQLRERVQLMVRQNIQVAEIRLDPAELGQMQIRINLQQEQASVQFIVQQQHAKELLEQQMPRLRELLQQQGIQLGEGQVQQHSRQQQGNGDGSQRPGQTANHSADSFNDDLPAANTVEVQHRERLVDYYA